METPLLCEVRPTAAAGWVEVMVDAPGAAHTYTYRLPEGLSATQGDVVCVPFGPRLVGGIVIGCLDRLPEHLESDQMKLVEAVLGSGFFPPGYWALLERVANYYLAPLARVIETALPPGLLSRAQRRVRLCETHNPLVEWTLSAGATGMLAFLRAQKRTDFSWRFLVQRLPEANRYLKELLGKSLLESYFASPNPPKARTQQYVSLLSEEYEGLTPRQREVLQCLKRLGGEAKVEALVAGAGTARSVLVALEKRGCLAIDCRAVRRGTLTLAPADSPKALTDEQQAVLAQLRAASPGGVLLHGVTGSGKTEVYLQAIAPVLARGESALVLVPEIGLTPQLTDRFTARFGAAVLVYHSALSEGERYDAWRQMLSDEPQVVIGTRSAVFAPLPKLGIIVLDEEHDSSYKQDRPAPCYHARTVALWRAETHSCPVLLGSATPDIESYRCATAQEFLHLTMKARVAGRPLPAVEVVDMREELNRGNLSPFSARLQQAICDMREAGRQGILFINRRGYSTFVLCRNCGESLRCPHCAVSLTYHRLDAGDHLRCHYCNYSRAQPRACPQCSSPHLRYFGAGTQRIAAQLAELFAGLRILRFDRDTTSRKDSHRQILGQFARQEADILVGTQMLTKGLDLPQVTLVGILAADGLLNLPDYRSGERAFQLLTQVAGRAGRGEEPGQVILQTYAPEHPVVEAAQTHNYHRFVEAELEQRRALGYPPFTQFIALQFSGPEEGRVIAVSEALAAILDGSTDFEGQLLGPAPCAVERVANRYRWQLLIKNPAGKRGRECLCELLTRFGSQTGVAIGVDVDPLRLL